MKTVASFAKKVAKKVLPVKAPVAPLKQVSSGKSGGSKKVKSAATEVKKNEGKKVLPVGVSAPAATSKGVKKAKLFRSPFNQ